MKNYYLKEFKMFDGEFDITFNILDINIDKKTITVAVTNAGKIYITELDLQQDNNNNLYFQYGPEKTKIELNDFENINEKEKYNGQY